MSRRPPLNHSEIAAFLTIAAFTAIAIVMLFLLALESFRFTFNT